MKNYIILLLLACLGFTAQATTIAITPSSLEVITTGAASRTFYDLDDVFVRYKAGKVAVFDASNGVTLFDGDTSEVSVTGATHWAHKALKLATWYQDATTTSGYRYFAPKRGINVLYKGSNSVVKFVNNMSKRTLIETHLDSVKITGITGVSNKLTYLRGQYYLEGSRDKLGLPTTPTVAAGSAAGSSPTFVIAGTASAFKLTYTPGTTPLSSGTICTITLPVTYPNGTVLNVRNVDANAKADDAKVLVAGNAGTIVFTASTTALTAAAVHTYDVTVTGY